MKPLKYSYNNQTGMFRNKILIQNEITHVDARKQHKSTFENFGHFFAMKKTQKFDEIVSASTERTRIIDRFIIKYSKSLDTLINIEGTRIRIVHDGKIYDVVTAVNDNGLNETITLVGESEVKPYGN